jgi:Lhr-like helicase
VRDRDGTWRLTHPEQAARHRLNAGIIVDAEMLEVRFRNGRSLGKVEEHFGAQLSPATRSALPGWTWKWKACAIWNWWCARPRAPGRSPAMAGRACR